MIATTPIAGCFTRSFAGLTKQNFRLEALDVGPYADYLYVGGPMGNIRAADIGSIITVYTQPDGARFWCFV